MSGRRREKMMLKVENLSKSFNIHILDEKIIEGFRNVNFTLDEGRSLGISGPSGAGKSSIIKCIYRKYIPTGGDIYYESSQFGKVNLSNASENIILKIREHEIGYISQFLRVIPRVPCVDIVSEPLVDSGVTVLDARRKAIDILDRLEIPKKLYGAYPSTFSGGEQQRINIARAVIKRPRLLLLDEPTASLDRKSTSIAVEMFAELKKNGTTMIGIFHDREVLERFSDEIYELEMIKMPAA
jgi:alpha-D-ribose 1-methylphosphonate 5-triphosphate synthase subunit PhnL